MKTVLMLAIALVLISVPIVAYFFEDWYVYWSHALLSLAFGVLVVYLKVRYYWEES